MSISSNKPIKPSDELNEFILYTAPSGEVKIEIYVQNETVWLTQQKIADLFGVDRTVVTKHLKNIYSVGELEKTATSAKYAQVQKEGERAVTRNLDYYNLDAIISVGYRVNSTKATQFRIWATQRLKEYMIKGFALNDDRLESGSSMNYSPKETKTVYEISFVKYFYKHKTPRSLEEITQDLLSLETRNRTFIRPYN